MQFRSHGLVAALLAAVALTACDKGAADKAGNAENKVASAEKGDKKGSKGNATGKKK